MTRKELYAKVKALGIAAAIKTKFGDNYTRVSNADLESFINSLAKKAEKKVAPKKTAKGGEGSFKEAMIKLLSTLQAKRTITAKEAEEIVSLL